MTNILLLYCIILSIPEYSITFFILHDCVTVTCITTFIIGIMLLSYVISYHTSLSKLKIIKIKTKINKKKKKKKINFKLIIHNSDIIFFLQKILVQSIVTLIVKYTSFLSAPKSTSLLFF